MSFFRNVYAKYNRSVGRTTLGKLCLAFGIFLVVTTLFVYIAREVVEGETLHDDRTVLLRLNHFASPTLDHIMIGITTAGDVITVLTITLALLGLLAYRKKWQAFAQVAFGMLGAVLLNLVLKLVFERDRPHLWTWIIHESSYSFPSGHAMLTGALSFSIILLAWRTKWRWWVVTVGVVYMVLIGLSRMYLGVHYPTDILAGWCVSLAWVLAVATLLNAVRWPRLLK
jgi:membrane-associated phospholipid phosphatase